MYIYEAVQHRVVQVLKGEQTWVGVSNAKRASDKLAWYGVIVGHSSPMMQYFTRYCFALVFSDKAGYDTRATNLRMTFSAFCAAVSLSRSKAAQICAAFALV
jgi:hypothetical protein